MGIDADVETKITEWYAVYTRSRFEKKVHEDLCQHGIETFLPLYSQRLRRNNTSVVVERPLFTSYLFVNIDANSEQRFRVLDTRGVVSILGTRGPPTPVPESEIATIRCVLSARIPVTSIPWLQKGKRVRVVAGPLYGVEGVVEEHGRHNRLFIAIKSVGQSIIADVDARDVRAV